MSRFTPSVKYSTSFDGDNISMVLTRLKRKDAMRLAKFYQYDEKKKQGSLIGDEAELMEVVADVLPRYVNDFAGLVTAENRPMSIEEAIDEMYFMPLIGDILSELMNISSLSEDDEVKSEQPSDDGTQGSSAELKSFLSQDSQ